MGLQDGYRMVPVYLSERIAAEVPGFYAYLPKSNDDVSWQPRTGPSEPALRLRRAVQERVDRHCPPGMSPPTAQIVWVKEPPEEMWDEDTRHPGWGPVPDERPFEAIAVPDWLGRYTLLAAVEGTERVLPVYLLAEYVLAPECYALKGLPQLPLSAQTVAEAYGGPVSAGVSDDDIPF